MKQHQLAIARRTLKMPDTMVGMMGGMTKEQARQIIAEHNKARLDARAAMLPPILRGGGRMETPIQREHRLRARLDH